MARGRGRFASGVLVGWLICSGLLADGQQTRTTEDPQGKWEVLEGCMLSKDYLSDGDSFQVMHKGRTYIFRLYFVDTPELDTTLHERIMDQAAYFGIAPAEIPRGGALAAQYSLGRLKGRGFTVVTRWQNAMGRSKLARFYCIVLVKGENLAEELVANGLARIYGLRANWPDGPRSVTFINKLKNLELTARERRRGLWDEKSFLRTSGGGAAGVAKRVQTGTLDLNEASAEELQALPGIGVKLAERIIANRPYQRLDDLLKVPGIGTNNIERFRQRVRVEGSEER